MMALIVKDPGGSGGGDYAPIPEGPTQAVCVAIYDLGTHYSKAFDNYSNKVLLTWELPEHRINVDKDGTVLNLPRIISKEYTKSLHKKADLRRDLQSWRGKQFTDEELKGFDLLAILRANCMLQILHKEVGDKRYANIGGIMPIFKGMARLEPETDPVVFNIEDERIPETIPEWIQKKIMASQEWQNRGKPPIKAADNPAGDEEVPF